MKKGRGKKEGFSPIDKKREKKSELKDELIEMPIEGLLDLHSFQPKEIKELVWDYIDECFRRGVYDLRIIHGKGTGTLKAIVQSILKKHPAVASFRDADLTAGGWGATEVILKQARK